MAIVFPTSPTLGQVFTSGGRSWVWTGSTWDSPAGSPFVTPGAVLVATQNFTSQSSVFFDNIFNSNFDYYQIVASFIGSQESNMILRLRAGTVPLVGNLYKFNQIGLAAATVSYSNSPDDSHWRFGVMRTGQNSFVNATLANPARSGQSKNLVYQAGDIFSGTLNYTNGQGLHQTTLVYDGIALLPSAGTFSGSIRIYGLRN